MYTFVILNSVYSTYTLIYNLINIYESMLKIQLARFEEKCITNQFQTGCQIHPMCVNYFFSIVFMHTHAQVLLMFNVALPLHYHKIIGILFYCFMYIIF